MKTRRLFLVSFLIITVSMLTGWRSHRHHKKHNVEAPIEDVSMPKKLDLSLPLTIDDQTDFPVTQTKIEKPKKIKRDIELEPQTILSAEPEQDKIKSFDGAGVSINIKR